jgi:hypothetical protein
MDVSFIVILWTFVVTVLWLSIGFRAMRAHESLAESMDEIRRTLREYVETRSDKRDG